MPVLVAELLDGWPMKHSQTLDAFLQGCAPLRIARGQAIAKIR
jgi:hypothetical protein